MKIFVIIPVHNRKEITRECLNHLTNQTYNVFSVVVIDDGSEDGTDKMIEEEFPQTVLLHGEGNLWWTGSMNRGIEYVLTICEPEDYILVLNDDLTISEDYLEKLSILANRFPTSLIGSVIVNTNDKHSVLSGAIKVNWWTAKRINLDAGKDITLIPKGHFSETSLLTGRGVLIPVKVFREIGLYNNRHYKQFGDTELTKRAEKAGYQLIVSYDSIVYSQPLKTNNIMNDGLYELSDFWSYLFDEHANTNLIFRYWFAFDNANNFFQGTFFLFCDLVRITIHFFKHLNFKARIINKRSNK